MANKAISELPQAENVNNQDLFVLEQGGIAKKLPAETLITEQGIIDALAEALDGHGGISSVTLSSVSGRIRTYLITFSDGSATTFQVLDGTTITGIQKTSTAGLVDTYTVYMSDGTTSFFQVRNGQDGSATWDQINSKAPIITETVTGAIANFPDGADDIPVADLVVNIEPKQSGSGDPSPDNIRPISGWTGCNVTRAGKNLADISATTETASQNCSKVYENGGVVVTSTGNYGRVGYFIPTTIGSVYTISYKAKYTGSSAPQTLKFSDGVQWATPTYGTTILTTTLTSYTLTFTATSANLFFGIYPNTNGLGITIQDFQLEVGTTATSYEEYIEPTTLTVDWTTEAGTVYGGTLDVTTGLLTVTHQSFVWDGVTYPFTVQNNVFVNSKDGIKQKDASSTSNKIILKCDRFKPNGVGYRSECTDGTIIKVRGANNQIACYSSSFASVSDFNASLAQNPMTMVYELATPVTYQLTPQQLNTLLGTNNIWADTGNTTAEYRADTKLYIEKLTMPTEDDMVANQAITSGKYFMIGNSLYLALANIANGAQITIGTNAQRVSLADALNTINA